MLIFLILLMKWHGNHWNNRGEGRSRSGGPGGNGTFYSPVHGKGLVQELASPFRASLIKIHIELCFLLVSALMSASVSGRSSQVLKDGFSALELMQIVH